MPTTHHIEPTLANIRWGAFDASFAPVKTVDPGDLVILECVSGAPDVMPPAGSGSQGTGSPAGMAEGAGSPHSASSAPHVHCTGTDTATSASGAG